MNNAASKPTGCNITPEQLEASIHKSCFDPDATATEVFAGIHDLRDVLKNVFEIGFKEVSLAELKMVCPCCQNQPISLMLQSLAGHPRWVCRSCKGHKTYGASFLGLIQAFSDLSFQQITEKIEKYERQLKARKTKPVAPVPKNDAIFQLKSADSLPTTSR